ncbi:hypothetical protein DL764_007312 [Monosporascus ibericus]|uniref:Peptidase S8/S53 domain-containing protein n=1 Tax=Monosporascus ibericus TaxID=155417 RepID=A0A4Q4T502_9PEZI|nr:hypothetical protein DL764_007312 [Monosporascus ibericus]
MELISNILLAAFAVKASSTIPFQGDSFTAEHSYGFIRELEPGSSFGKRDLDREFKDVEYFHGLSIDDSNSMHVESLCALPQVKNIWANQLHTRPVPVELSTAGFALPGSSGFLKKSGGTKVARVIGKGDFNASLKVTEVDKLHKLSLTEKGIKIDVIDRGIDYRHRHWGGGFVKGFEVAGSYDLVGDDSTGFKLPVPDSDPLVDGMGGGHGTHVAGIIGARDPKGTGFGLVGVAPDATLYAYRILPFTGSVTDEVMMVAFHRAAQDGVDPSSMEASGAAVWEVGSPYGPLLAAIRKKGIGASIEYVHIVPVDDPSPLHVSNIPGDEQYFAQPYWNDAAAYFEDKEHVIVPLSSHDPAVTFGATRRSQDLSKMDSFLDVESYGSIFSVAGGSDKPTNALQALWQGYGSDTLNWQRAMVALDNGMIHELSNADYLGLVRALRLYYTDEKEYESWLGPIARVNISDPA